ncbi:MAG: Smr/MutS family protein [Burkholderiaceae bacterium]
MKAAKLVSLADLKSVKKEIDKQAAERVAAELARVALAKKLREDKEIFATAIGKVKPLPHKGKTHLPYDPPAPIPAQQQRDEQKALSETMSDEWDTSSLLDADESMSFRRPGIGADVVRKLRKGDWALQGQIDLHNLRSDEAREALGSFIRESFKNGLRCVRVVHGKGLGSPGKVPVLKNKVHSWLIQKNQVLAFVQATPVQGGAGALVVLLQAHSLR